MSRVFIVDIEGLENRYTKSWRKQVPELFKKEGTETITVSGTDYEGVTSGGFFDFNKRMVYCGEQQIKLANMISEGTIADGDVIFYTDAFNPAVLATQYCINMSNKNIKQYGYIHTNSFDTSDILSIQGNNYWAQHFERSMFECLETVYVATEYHFNQIKEHFPEYIGKFKVSGCPTDLDEIAQYYTDDKEKIIVFPHRINEDKNPELFESLKEFFPEYELVYTQDKPRTKKEYYELLAKADIVLSFAKHENYGIAMIESLMLGAKVFMPYDKSYKEMYSRELLYDRMLEDSPVQLANWIKGLLKDSKLDKYLKESRDNITNNYCSFSSPINDIKKEINE